MKERLSWPPPVQRPLALLRRGLARAGHMTGVGAACDYGEAGIGLELATCRRRRAGVRAALGFSLRTVLRVSSGGAGAGVPPRSARRRSVSGVRGHPGPVTVRVLLPMEPSCARRLLGLVVPGHSPRGGGTAPGGCGGAGARFQGLPENRAPLWVPLPLAAGGVGAPLDLGVLGCLHVSCTRAASHPVSVPCGLAAAPGTPRNASLGGRGGAGRPPPGAGRPPPVQDAPPGAGSMGSTASQLLRRLWFSGGLGLRKLLHEESSQQLVMD
ncbi:hypothetical protein NDU88_000016 [Pleurodeles waltl]|uniref:Uncharacterized protein n=1 Tax=Pleurodeles waltl TaxID=8319 RepID=A0AAV7KNG3_PLEWA|nr:hypothetical protein NDU88_000016 [Pleurodeles waltl]